MDFVVVGSNGERRYSCFTYDVDEIAYKLYRDYTQVLTDKEALGSRYPKILHDIYLSVRRLETSHGLTKSSLKKLDSIYSGSLQCEGLIDFHTKRFSGESEF